MPSTGMAGARMLRARRRDQNLKPNRRLDRKSSRGMLYENEELRMRTITINAEVEQGQQALKRLRRENEQLRREMWTLRDEYDKMEKLLQEKGIDDSDQDSDSEYSQSDEESDTEDTNVNNKEENPDLDNEENLQKSSKLNNLPIRSFDGLSVIDEQTEETTQTTDPGYGYSRSGSACARTEGDGERVMYDEACGGEMYAQPMQDYQGYDNYLQPKPYQNGTRKKGVCFYTEGDPNVAPPPWGYDPWDAKREYGGRPSSPYPYSKSIPFTSYDKRIEHLQNLPVPNIPSENGWIFPNRDMYSPIGFVDRSNYYNYNPSVTDPITIQIPSIPENEPRSGPDYFITGAYPQTLDEEDHVIKPILKVGGVKLNEEEEETVTEDAEMQVNNKMIEHNNQGQNEVKREETLPKIDFDVSQVPDISSTSVKPIAEDTSKQDNVLVSCQSSNNEDNEETVRDHLPADEDPQILFPKISNRIALFENQVKCESEIEEMPRSSSTQTLPNRRISTTKPFQSKLIVTLKNPKKESATRSKFQPIQPSQPTPIEKPPRIFAPTNAPPRLNYPYSKPPPYTNNPPNRYPSKPEINGNSERTETDHKDGEAGGVVTNGKTPPPPPPRSSSSNSGNLVIPTPAIGVTALHHRAFRKGRSQSPNQKGDLEAPATAPIILQSTPTNPLLNNQPAATSSPQLKPKNQDQDHQKHSNEDSSLEETGLTRQASTKSDIVQTSPKTSIMKNSPNLQSFRKPIRKPSSNSLSSLETMPNYSSNSQLIERKNSKNRLNNTSVSSSSGLDSPTKSDRRKRRVSIKFNKKPSLEEQLRKEELLEEELKASNTKKESLLRKFSKDKSSLKHKNRGKLEEDATVSERERTNSVSSRNSSLNNSTRRKFSISSTRTLGTDEKIPWCGCWGNGCV